MPEIHAVLTGRGVAIAERSVTNLLDRYDELLATRLMERRPLQKLLAQQRAGYSGGGWRAAGCRP